jgi:hypothetical protein
LHLSEPPIRLTGVGDQHSGFEKSIEIVHGATRY